MIKIKPSAELKAQKQNTAKCLIAEIKKFGYNAEIVGSLAKDTDLAYTHDTDIDIFIKFPIQFNKKETGKKATEITSYFFKLFVSNLYINIDILKLNNGQK